MYMAEKTTKLADKLYLLRAERRLQSKDVASVIGVEPPMYSRIEKGERNIKPEQLQKLAEFYHIDIEELHALWLADKVCEVAIGMPAEVTKKAISIVNHELE